MIRIKAFTEPKVNGNVNQLTSVLQNAQPPLLPRFMHHSDWWYKWCHFEKRDNV